ncbi:MAG: ribonuclease HII [Pseudomonadota bacterium]
MEMIAGVDEAGRGPLAGPVCAAAVILDPEHPIVGLNDSKKLSESRRNELDIQIQDRALDWGIGWATVEEIDELNILQATLLAMTRAVEVLKITPHFVRVDGNRLPAWRYRSEAVVKGDSLHAEISAASILAKQARDKLMLSFAKTFPDYGFDSHKGYPTKQHLSALRSHGATPIHRRSFSPVSNLDSQ